MKALHFILTLTFALSGAIHAVEPVNDKCPVCGKNGRLIFHSNYKGERVIFDTSDCKDKFDKAPGNYKVIPKK
jgi:hypothetical protein